MPGYVVGVNDETDRRHHNPSTLPTWLSAFLKSSSLRTILTCSNHTLQEKKANALAKEAEAAKKAAAIQAKAAKNDEQKAAAAAAAKKAEDDAAGT